MTKLEHILLFKTNISSEEDKLVIQPTLDSHASIRHWTVDLNDCDFVLRIESESLDHQQVINLISDHGFECCELI